MEDWKAGADRICDEMLKTSPKAVRRLADSLYETLMNDVQDYLRENVEYNLSSELARARNEAEAARECLRNVRDYVTDAIEAEKEADEHKVGLLAMMTDDLSRIDVVITRNGSVRL